MTSKVTSVTSTTEVTEAVDSTYNLQGRLETVTTTPYTGGVAGIDSEATYTYNPQGIRVSKDVDDTITDYLIDPYNHTGHAQVLEETTGSSTITYTIGDDVIAQHNATDGTEYMLYDGHGSTRQLAKQDKSITDSYSYDGYGVMLGADDTAADNADTTMLYAGEQYDSSASMYYNRARYYNPSNGLFNRVDPYSGNTSDPQSLHKYAYCHNNPINGIDPTGMFGFSIGGFSIVSFGIMLLIGLLITMPNVMIARLTSWAYIKIKTTDNWFSRTYRVNSAQDIVDKFKEIQNKNVKITFFEYTGHGTGDENSPELKGWGLTVGESGIYTKLMISGAQSEPPDTWMLEDMKPLILDVFDSKATIELEACNTAYNTKSIAYAFKNILPNAHVWGFTGPAYPIPITFVHENCGGGGTQWKEVE